MERVECTVVLHGECSTHRATNQHANGNSCPFINGDADSHNDSYKHVGPDGHPDRCSNKYTDSYRHTDPDGGPIGSTNRNADTDRNADRSSNHDTNRVANRDSNGNTDVFSNSDR